MVVIHEEPPSASTPPQAIVLDAMQRHNIESVEAGIMLAGHRARTGCRGQPGRSGRSALHTFRVIPPSSSVVTRSVLAAGSEADRILNADDMGAGVVAAAQGRVVLGHVDVGVTHVEIAVADIDLAVIPGIPLPAQRQPQAAVIRYAGRTIGIAHGVRS